MRDQEQRLALTLVQRQHSLLSQDLHFNVASVDTRGVTGSLDLVGYFTEDSYGCEERVWVELKAWGTTTFDTYFQKEQEELPSRLVKEQRKDTSLCGVLLVRLGICACTLDSFRPRTPPCSTSVQRLPTQDAGSAQVGLWRRCAHVLILLSVFLVAARVQKAGRVWKPPLLTAVLWSATTRTWLTHSS